MKELNKYLNIRLLLPMVLGYIMVYFCKMNNSGKNVKFRPPAYIFSIVWPILYLLLGFSWNNSIQKYDIKIELLYLVLIELLTKWIYIYSCRNNKQIALYILLFTLLIITILMILVPTNSKLLLSPLLIWIFFATLMSVTEIQS